MSALARRPAAIVVRREVAQLSPAPGDGSCCGPEGEGDVNAISSPLGGRAMCGVCGFVYGSVHEADECCARRRLDVPAIIKGALILLAILFVVAGVPCL